MMKIKLLSLVLLSSLAGTAIATDKKDVSGDGTPSRTTPVKPSAADRFRTPTSDSKKPRTPTRKLGSSAITQPNFSFGDTEEDLFASFGSKSLSTSLISSVPVAKEEKKEEQKPTLVVPKETTSTPLPLPTPQLPSTSTVISKPTPPSSNAFGFDDEDTDIFSSYAKPKAPTKPEPVKSEPVKVEEKKEKAPETTPVSKPTPVEKKEDISTSLPLPTPQLSSIPLVKSKPTATSSNAFAFDEDESDIFSSYSSATPTAPIKSEPAKIEEKKDTAVETTTVSKPTPVEKKEVASTPLPVPTPTSSSLFGDEGEEFDYFKLFPGAKPKKESSKETKTPTTPLSSLKLGEKEDDAVALSSSSGKKGSLLSKEEIVAQLDSAVSEVKDGVGSVVENLRESLEKKKNKIAELKETINEKDLEIATLVRKGHEEISTSTVSGASASQKIWEAQIRELEEERDQIDTKRKALEKASKQQAIQLGIAQDENAVLAKEIDTWKQSTENNRLAAKEAAQLKGEAEEATQKAIEAKVAVEADLKLVREQHDQVAERARLAEEDRAKTQEVLDQLKLDSVTKKEAAEQVEKVQLLLETEKKAVEALTEERDELAQKAINLGLQVADLGVEVDVEKENVVKANEKIVQLEDLLRQANEHILNVLQPQIKAAAENQKLAVEQAEQAAVEKVKQALEKAAAQERLAEEAAERERLAVEAAERVKVNLEGQLEGLNKHILETLEPQIEELKKQNQTVVEQTREALRLAGEREQQALNDLEVEKDESYNQLREEYDELDKAAREGVEAADHEKEEVQEQLNEQYEQAHKVQTDLLGALKAAAEQEAGKELEAETTLEQMYTLLQGTVADHFLTASFKAFLQLNFNAEENSGDSTEGK